MKRAILWISIAAGATAIATWAATTMPSDNSTPTTMPTAAAPATQPTSLAQATQPSTQPTASATPATNPSQASVAQNDQGNQGGNNNFYNQGGGRNRRGFRNGNGNGNDNSDQGDNSDIPPTSPMLAMYDAVSARNLFIKGRQDQNYQVAPDNGAGFGNFNRGPQPLVFDGASLTDGPMVAYIEDTGTGNVTEAKIGDSDPRFGKITQITLDELDLKQGDKTITIAAGQTLSGQSAFDTLYLSPTVTPAAVAAVPTTLPTGDDIISMMRRRRLQEQQQLNGGPPGGGAPGAPGATTPPAR
jgi:hypothetical protein